MEDAKEVWIESWSSSVYR